MASLSRQIKRIKMKREKKMRRKKGNFSAFDRNLLRFQNIGVSLGGALVLSAIPAAGMAGEGFTQIVDGAVTTYNQTDQKVFNNVDSYNIASDETHIYNQPSSDAIFVQRVSGQDYSSILGQLTANGQVWVLNPGGILIGSEASINTAGFLASNLTLDEDDFFEGRYQFSQEGDGSFVINEGDITVGKGGYAILAGGSVLNNGYIEANGGEVVLAAGRDMTIDFDGDGLLNFSIDEGIAKQIMSPDGALMTSAVLNSGQISAAGGRVLLTAETVNGILDNVVNNEGYIEASTVVEKNGVIELIGGDEGSVINSGILDASGDDPGENGGIINIEGEYAGQFGTAVANAGSGGYAGQISVRSTEATALGSGSLTQANGAGADSDGGDIFIFSEGLSLFRSGAEIQAKGGGISGDGGFIEVSGDNVEIRGTADTSAVNGSTGTFYIDPVDITIQDVDSSALQESPAGTWASDGSSGTTILDIDDLITSLSSNNVIVSTQLNSDSLVAPQGADITVSTAINSASNNNLSLIAGEDVIINAAIDLGTGDLTINAGERSDINSGSVTAVFSVTADDLTVTSDTSIVMTNLTVNTMDLTVNQSGVINVTSTQGVSVTAANNSNNDIGITVTSGNLQVSDINAGTGIVTLTSSAGAIEESGADAGADITAGTIDFNAATGIGAAGTLEITGTSVSADTTNGNIDIDSIASGTVTVSSLATSTGDIQFDQTGGTALTVSNATTNTEGSITLSNTGANLTLNTVTAGGAGNIVLTTATSGNVIAGSITADDDQVDITAADSILDDGNNANDITASTINLTAGADIGSGTGSGTVPSGYLDIDLTPDPDPAITLTVNAGASVYMNFTNGAMSSSVVSGIFPNNLTNVGIGVSDNDFTFDDEAFGTAADSNAFNLSVIADNIILNSDDVGGDMDINTTGDVLLRAAVGGITDGADFNTALDIIAGSVALEAATGIGAADALDIRTTSVSADASAGNVDINNLSPTGTVTASSLTTGTGVIIFDQTGGQDLAVTSASATDGAVTVTNDNGDLIVNSASAGGNNDITITTTAAGDVTLGDISADGDTAGITAAGAIYDDGDDGTTSIMASVINLNSGTDIGASAGAGNIPAGYLDIDLTGSPTLNLTMNAGNKLYLNLLNAAMTSSSFGGLLPAGLTDIGIGVTSNSFTFDDDFFGSAANTYNLSVYADSIALNSAVGANYDINTSGTVVLSAVSGGITDGSDADAQDILAGTLDLNAAAGIGTGGAIEIRTSGITADTTAGVITLINTPAGAVAINSMTTGDASDITYTQNGQDLSIQGLGISASGGSILIDPPVNIAISANISTIGAGDITIEASGNIVQSDGVTVGTADGDIIIRGNGAGNEALSYVMADNSTLLSTNGGNLTVRANIITLDNVTTTGNVILDANGAPGDITTQAAGTAGLISANQLTADTDGSININTAISSADLTTATAGTITVTESDAVTLADVDTFNGTISVTAGGTITAADVDTTDSGNNADITLSATGGDVLLGDVNAGTGTAEINAAAGAIDESGTDAGADVTAVTVDLNAAAGIGSAGAVDVTGGTITADTTNGNINIDSLALAGVTAASLTTGTGDIQFDQTGGQTLDVTSAVTADGNIVITNDNADLTLVTVTAGGAGQNVTLTTTTGGNIIAGNVTASDDTVTATSAGSINSITDDGTADITAGTINLTAAALGIGTGSIIDVTATAALNADTDAGDDSSIIIDSIGDLPVGLVNAGAGDVTIDSTGAIDSVTDDGTADIEGSNINLMAALGGIGASSVLDVTAAAALNADTVTGDDGDIMMDSIGDLPVGLVDAGAGDVYLDSTGAIDSVTDDGTADIDGATISLTAAAGGIGASSVVDITAATALNADTDAGDDGDIIIDSIGNLPVGLVDAGAGDVTLDSTGAINSVTDDEAADIEGATINLMAALGGIGTSSVLDVTAATALNADTVSGDAGNILIDSIGDLPVGLVDAGAGNVTLDSTAGINGVTNDNTADVVGTIINLDAVTGIGTGITLDITGTAVSADTTDGSIDIDSLAAAGVTAGSLTTGTGDIQFDQTGGQTLDVTTVATTDGDIVITNDSADMTVGAVTAGGAGQNVTLTTTTSGDIVAGDVTAADDMVTVTSAGAIDGAVDDGTADITAGTINLTAAAGGIGLLSTVDVTAATALNADTDAGDDSNILIDSIGDLPVGLIDAGAGNVTIDSTGAIDSVSDDGTADIEGSNINLMAALGGIGNTSVLDVTAATALNADTVTGDDGDIMIDSIGDLPVGLVDAGTGDVYLDSTGAIDSVTDDNTADVAGGTVSLTAAAGGIGTASIVDVTAGTVFNADTDAGDDGNIIVDSIGDLPVGLVNAGAGDVTLDSTGAVNSVSDDETADIEGATINLMAALGGIGTSSVLDISAATALNADTVTGDDGDIMIDSIGDLPVGLVDAGTGDVYLDSTGAIDSVSDDGTADIDGAAVNLTAAVGGIGTTSVLDVTAAAAFNADTDAGDDGNILIDSIGDLPVGLVDAGAGDVTLDSTGAVNSVTDDGTADIEGATINLTAAVGGIGTSSVLDVTASTALNADTDAGDDSNISIDSIGDLPVGLIAAGAGNVTLDSTGNISDGAADGAADVTGADLNATAQGGIELDTTVTTMTLDAQAAGHIDIDETDGVTLTSITAADGMITIDTGGATNITSVVSSTDDDANDITITASAGDIEVDTVTTGGTVSDVILTASAGSITDGDANSTVTADDLNLSAANSIGVTGGNRINTTAVTITADSTTDGDIALNETDAVTLVSITTSDGAVEVISGDDMKVTSVISADTGSDEAHDVTLTATAGDILLDSVTADNEAILSADAGSITDNNGSTVNITSVDVDLSAQDEIGAITDFDAETGDAIEIAIAGSINNASTTAASSTINLSQAGSLTISAGSISIAGAGQGSAILTTSGDLDAGAVNSIDLAGNDSLALNSGGTLTIPAAGLDAGTGDLRMTGATDVLANGGGALIYSADDLYFSSGGSGGNSVLAADLNSITAHVAANNLTINEIDAITLTDVDTVNGSITVNAGGTITALDVDTTDSGNNGDITLTAAAGNVELGDVNAGTGTASITSVAGAVEESGTDADADVMAAVIDLNASTGIGAAGTLEVTGTAVTADTTNGNIDIDSLADAAVTVTSLTSGTGDIQFDQTGGQTLAVTAAAATDGDISVTNDNADMTLTMVTAGGAGQNITVTTTTGGDIVAGSLTAADDMVTVTSAGSIDGAADDGVADITAGTVSLTAASGGIGTTTVLDITAAAALNADTDAGDDGNIMIDSIGDLPVGLVDAGAGNVTLDSTGAIDSAADDGTADVTGETISLTAAAGGIGTTSVIDVTAATALNADTDAGDDGNIMIDSIGNLPVGLIAAGAGDVTIDSTGDISDGASDSAADITGDDLNAIAQGGIELDTTVGTLTLDAQAAGDIDIDETDGATLTSITASNGMIGIDTGGAATVISVVSTTDSDDNYIRINALSGDVEIDTVTTGGTASDVVIGAAGGSITDMDGNSTVTADDLGLAADNDIGIIGGNRINTTVNTIEAMSNDGDIALNETDALTLADISAADGAVEVISGNSMTVTSVTSADAGSDETHDITLTATAGNILLGSVTADNEAVLNADAGSIIDNNGVTLNITSVDIDLSAQNAIGTITDFAAEAGDAIEIAITGSINNVSTTAASSTINLNQAGALTISAGSINIAGANQGSAILTTSGDLDAGAVNSIALTGSDSLALNSGGTLTIPAAGFDAGTGDLRMTGASGAAANGGGALIFSSDDIYLSSGAAGAAAMTTDVASASVHLGGAGALTINETSAITLADVDTSDGSITVTAAGDVTALDVVSLTDSDTNDITITSTGGAIDVGSINSGTMGDVIIDAQGGAVTTSGVGIIGDDLTADAAAGITLTTDVDSADISVGAAGNIMVVEADSITLADIDTSDGYINITAGGDITVTDISTTDGGNNGNITLTSTSGDIAIGDVDGGTASVTLTAADSIMDDDDTATDITADTANLTAVSGTIGSWDIPVDVDVDGTLFVQAGGLVSGLSVNLQGGMKDALTYNRLNIPGLIIFNGDVQGAWPYMDNAISRKYHQGIAQNEMELANELYLYMDGLEVFDDALFFPYGDLIQFAGTGIKAEDDEE